MSAIALMRRQRPFAIETLTAIGLIVAPFILPHLGFAPTTMNRIVVWGLFGIGFDILFGFTGLLSFGQSAFYGTGGMVAAYLLTIVGFPYVVISLFIGMIVAAIVGYLVGLIALRRTGIYFAMITVAIAEVFYFVEFNPLSDYTGGENGLPGVPTPTCRSASPPFTSTPIGRSTRSSRSGISSASSSRCASCARRSAPCSAPSATTRCAPPRSATTSTATSSPPSSSPRPMPALPAACSA